MCAIGCTLSMVHLRCILPYTNKFEIICKCTVNSVVSAMYTISEQIAKCIDQCPITLSLPEQLLSKRCRSAVEQQKTDATGYFGGSCYQDSQFLDSL